MKKSTFLILCVIALAVITVAQIQNNRQTTEAVSVLSTPMGVIEETPPVTVQEIEDQQYITQVFDEPQEIAGQRNFGSDQNNIDPIGQKQLVLPGNLQLLNAMTADNLTMYYITGSSSLAHKSYVTLQEALENEWLRVDETGAVSELQGSNKSNRYIYINSGDIVRGGKQDRTIRYDIIIPPMARNVDLASFCVESGRWSQRNNEPGTYFSISENCLSSNNLRIAAKKQKSQGGVWSEVSKMQEKLDEVLVADYAVSRSVKSTDSESSLELTLSNQSLDSIRQLYADKVIIDGTSKRNILGFAYFINGELYGIDLYNNKDLFEDLSKKLINAAITEAISLRSGQENYSCDQTQINKILKSEVDILASEQLNEATEFITMLHKGKKDTHLFECVDSEENTWLHYNVIVEQS